MTECAFPNCPSGVNLKLLDERHDEVKTHLTNIESNQKEMIIVVQNVATLLANVNHIEDQIKDNKKEHDEVFGRLRKLEISSIMKKDLVWGITAIAGIFTILQVIFKWVIK